MEDLDAQIAALEAEFGRPDFWDNKTKAQTKIKELAALKAKKEGRGEYDQGPAIITILAGAGGVDAEDFARLLLAMYQKFATSRKFTVSLIHQNQNDHGGYRNVTIQIDGPGAYGILKNESGVHRLVRISPFNAKSLRHTSFALVEVLPRLSQTIEFRIPDDELKVEFARASGPGGQNVNKRETAVRLTHLPTNLSVHVDNERSQAQNRDRALEILTAKLYKRRQAEAEAKRQGMFIAKTTEIEWGNQIRSYVLHPYKLIKDHRTKVQTRDIDRVLDGDLDEFLNAEKHLAT